MTRRLFLLFFALSTLHHAASARPESSAASPSDYVDPWIGSQGPGHVFIGPSLPFGMIKPAPDTGKNDTNSGWSPNGAINGFSQTHVSGTGGGAKYGNILIMPTTGEFQLSDIGSERGDETSKLCYYSVLLKRYNVKAEITTASRASIYRFTYPDGETARLIFDPNHFLYFNIAGEGQRLAGSSVRVLSPTEVAGHASVTGGWNLQPVPYTVYFYAVSDTPAASRGTRAVENASAQAGKAPADGPERTVAWLEFRGKEARTVRVKVGISFVSVEQARANVREIDRFDFDGTREKGVAIWNDALGKIRVEGGTEEQKRVFYTCMYHSMLMPSDRTGENPLWKSKEPYYDDFYAIWDTFRTTGPLLTLIAPRRQADTIRALIDIQKHEGFLPDGRSGNYNGRVQGGSNADVFIADAYVKKLPGINWKDAYAAVKTNAEVPPEDHFKEGRGGLEDWRNLGYLTMEGVDRSPGKHMEYAYNDFCIAQIAAGMGLKKDAELYFGRSGQWANLWDESVEDGGVRGFIRTRHRDGRWMEPFSPRDGCTWKGHTFYEGNSWTYSFFVPHDVASLIEKCGGNEAFVKRLDAFFDVRGRCDITNEPFFLTPYMYIWAGRHDKTAERLPAMLGRYRAAPNGLPGNDDSGALGAWYVFGAMGFFPNAGQDYYLIGSPVFSKSSISLANGRTFSIRAENPGGKNIYVASATLNGKKFDRAWISHSQIMEGGELVLKMSDTPGAWGRDNPPPSPLSAVK